ncbi:MAG: CHASE domain-containing protein [Kiritimatiellae bacterium]|nr:CHASE domain-containing protein [Kiritimatiellia bacterium]MDW8457658.1 CHASE domain-containing protein [Verrucomicrobiota bacterium]
MVSPMGSSSRSAPSRTLWALVALTTLAGLGLTFWASRESTEREQARLEAEFQLEVRTLVRALEREIGLFVSVLASLGELHTLSEAVSDEAFAEFVGKGLLHQKSVLGAFGFAQRIPRELRAAAEYRGEDSAPLPFTEWTPNGIRPAGDRSEYFPLTYQAPELGLGLPLGFDMASLPGQSAALERIRSGGGSALGALAPSFQPGQPAGFFVLAPIRAEGELRGFTVAALWPQAVLERALQQAGIRQMQITFFDPQFGVPPRSPEARWIAELPVAVADQEWMLRCEVGEDYRTLRGAGSATLIAAAGTVITVLLAAALGILAERARAIERTVSERTRELLEANRLLAAEMDERARLQEALQTATLREQQRIGQDLHDSLGQKLTGAVFLARAVGAAGEAERAELLEKLIDLLKESIAQVRRMARGLAPLEVGEEGLAPALRRLAEETCEVFNIACSFDDRGAPPGLSREAAIHLYHIAQEAVSNAVKHGGATDVRIDLTEQALRIEDNGRGFDPAAQSDGAGLRIMRHRAARAGGRFEIRSEPGRTIVRVEFRAPPGH